MVRDDVTVNWDVSPRIITVAAPSVDISIQDLHDTLRTLEAAPEALDNVSIVDSAGKELLGPGLSVALTMTLSNAKLAFEARPGPAWVLCTISGGNLVAIDANGDPMEPREPTAYVTVDRALSASATLQTGSGVTEQDKAEIITGVRSEMDTASTRLALVDAAVSSRLAAGASAVLQQDKDDIVGLVLDGAGGVEAEITLRQAIRLLAAVMAGDIERSGVTFSIKGATNPARTRVTGTVDGAGNRNVTAMDVGA